MKEETKKCLKKARRDTGTAAYNLKGKKLDAAAFYSQQAAEKALKAVQIEVLGEFRKIHDLVALAKSVGADEKTAGLCDMGSKKSRIVKELKEFKAAIRKEYGVEKIIFFGSRAAGVPRRDSDVDLILVSKKFRGKSHLKRPLGLRFYWNLKYPVDFICYTPEEFEKLRKGVTIVSQALREGVET